jgi:two-component system, OmpR family, alkaline phosphatase synthesis response regulator PhoP
MSSRNMRRKKILAVDDSQTILLVERAILGPHFDVTTASSGEEGLGCATADPPDLVLVDLEMPGINGFETCRRLRSSPLTSETPIILVTSHSEGEALEGAFLHGCTDYVIKPIDGDELLMKVSSYLGE